MEGQGSPPEFLSTHPDPGNRIQAIEDKARELNCPGDQTYQREYDRIKALLRRSAGGEATEKLQVDELLLDAESRRIFIGDTPVDMGPTEFNLLQFFMSHPERAYSRNQLLDQVWGANVYVEERTVDVHIGRLRKALVRGREADPIRTVRGAGYVFGERSHTSTV